MTVSFSTYCLKIGNKKKQILSSSFFKKVTKTWGEVQNDRFSRHAWSCISQKNVMKSAVNREFAHLRIFYTVS